MSKKNHFIINEIHIENYKSFKQIKINLGKLNIIVGENDSGKSNFIDVFHFISDFFKLGYNAIKMREGFKTIVFNHDINSSIIFEIKGLIGKKVFRYYLKLSSTKVDYLIDIESFKFKSKNAKKWKTILNYKLYGEKKYISEDSNWTTYNFTKNIKRESNLVEMTKKDENPLTWKFIEAIKNLNIFQFSSNPLKEPIKLERELLIRNDGKNLPNVAQVTYNEFSEKYAEFFDVFKSLYPQYEKLTLIITSDRRIYFKLIDKNKIEHEMWLLSEGLVKIMCILFFIYAPKNYDIICIEEVENHIHPRLMNDLFEYLELISDETQLFITSHSPHFLNVININRINLISIEKKNGISNCNVIKEEPRIADLLTKLGLGEIIFSKYSSDYQ